MGLSSTSSRSFASAAMLGLLSAVAPGCAEEESEGAGEGSGQEALSTELDAAGGAGHVDHAYGGSADSASPENDEMREPLKGPGGGTAESEETDESAPDCPAYREQVIATGTEGPGSSSGDGITKSKIIPDISEECFREECKKVDGVVETFPVCGNRNTGPGFSYDVDTDMWTEHTCAGYNTCVGWSCKIPE